MPLYEYKCNNCGHLFEDYQKTLHEPEPKCINCGGKVQKLISAPAVIDIEGSFPTASKAKAWSAQKRLNQSINRSRGVDIP